MAAAAFEAAEAALEDLQQRILLSGLPPDISVQRLAAFCDACSRTATMLHAQAVVPNGENDEAYRPARASRMVENMRGTVELVQNGRLTARRQASFSRVAGHAHGAEHRELSAAEFHAVCKDAQEHLSGREVHVVMPVASLSAEPSPRSLSPSSQRRSRFASRMKADTQRAGSRLNVRRRGSFGRHPLASAGNNDAIYSDEQAEQAEQAAAAFHAAFPLPLDPR